MKEPDIIFLSNHFGLLSLKGSSPWGIDDMFTKGNKMEEEEVIYRDHHEQIDASAPNVMLSSVVTFTFCQDIWTRIMQSTIFRSNEKRLRD